MRLLLNCIFYLSRNHFPVFLDHTTEHLLRLDHDARHLALHLLLVHLLQDLLPADGGIVKVVTPDFEETCLKALWVLGFLYEGAPVSWVAGS